MSNEYDNGAIIFDPVTANDVDGRDLGIFKRRGCEGSIVGEAEPPPSATYLASQSPELIVREITDRIERTERRLSETTGTFDPATGQPVPVAQGKLREGLERELATLRYSSLPFAKARAAEIAAAKATLPTAASKLAAEGARRDRIKARALEIAEEAEAEAMAERLRAAKRAQSAA